MIHTMRDTHASIKFLSLYQFAQRNNLWCDDQHNWILYIEFYFFLINIDFTSKLSHRQVWERFEDMDVVIFNDAGKMWHLQYIIYLCSSFTDELSYMIRIFWFLLQNPFR